MAKREFGQYCGLARAVEIVGERWALLIIRDLLVGPRRYTDLRNGLPKIPTNILSARLKEMEAAGVVQRRVLPRPDGSVVYELTDYGRDLEEAVMHLSRWGARSLGEPRPGEIVTPASMVLAMRNTFRPEAAAGLAARYEVRMGETVFHMRVADGALNAGEGPLPDADLVIETGMAIKAVMAGEITPAEAVATGAVRIEGDPALLERFAEVFAI
ncbi:winged helix-turn-helix transcriptional regulator [Planomonospora alba]|uniref:Winged helix-turn-helix transcriptional regulator n=1 Tax=Planomonospora alba TaxID=161354 RepID=A0ABP6MUS7_9ACTN